MPNMLKYVVSLFSRLMSFHGFPFAWFIAQFLKFLMRPSTALQSYIMDKRNALGIGEKDGPIVG